MYLFIFFERCLRRVIRAAQLGYGEESRRKVVSSRGLGSGDSVVDNTIDYQFRDRKIDTPLLRSFG